MMTNDISKLTFDPEEMEPYELILTLSQEDFARAMHDQRFAQSLLTYSNAATTVDDSALVYTENEDANTIINESTVEDMNTVVTEESDDDNRKIPHLWHYNQVVELIRIMGNYLEDFNHPKKRKHIYELITNDLTSLKFKVDTVMVQSKWKSLVKSYKKAKDNKNRTGHEPSRFHFFELMDEILGSNPTNSCSHSINSDGASTSSAVIDSEVLEPCTPSSKESVLQSTVSVKNKLSEKQLKREYIILKKEEYAKRQKRHEERLTLELERNELEKKKLEILEKYLQQRD